ncbi:FhaA domain-containing protein [Streptomyces phaeoluteigriseus]|uniref:FhaA domain-containing protein n=1 Tax=Streptomyces phaeoluteigriseus TaxID=114686 RepID=UPI00367B2FDF
MEGWVDALGEALIPRAGKRAEVVRILHCECDDGALILDRRRTLVPNTFVIELPPESHLRLAPGSAEVVGHLAAQVRRHAAEQGYTFAGPVAVHLARTDDADVGRFRVRSRIVPSEVSRAVNTL